jgi:DNA-binding MarR family transcriptional regulator
MSNASFLYHFQDSLGHNLHRIGQLVREETGKALQPFGITPEQWQILVALSRTDGLTPTELGDVTLRDKTTISRMLPALFRKGLLLKTDNPADGRSYVVKASDPCKQLVGQTLEAVKHHFQERVFASLDPQEQEVLLQLILKLRKGLGDL